MECNDLKSCFQEIEAYCKGEANGFSLFVNTENDHDLQQILSRMKGDRNKVCLAASSTCLNQLFPQMDAIRKHMADGTCLVLYGLAPYYMLLGRRKAYEKLREWMGDQCKGHVILLLSHMKDLLWQCMGKDPRMPRRVVFLAGISSSLPRLRFYPKNCEFFSEKLIDGFQALLGRLETYDSICPVAEFEVKTTLQKENFPEALYSISSYEGVYKEFCKSYREVGQVLSEEWGTEAEWTQLAKDWERCPSWSGLSRKYFGVEDQYDVIFPSIWYGNDDYKKWLIWLLLRIHGTENSSYLSLAMAHSQSPDDLDEHMYLDIAQIDEKDERFLSFFAERQKLLSAWNENASYVTQYQNALAQKGKGEIYYLSDRNRWEDLRLLTCLQDYSYEKETVLDVLQHHFPDLAAYMKPFTFTPAQLGRDDSQKELCQALTRYFDWYKWQKLENRVDPDFEVWVEDLATQRVYNQLDERSLLMKRVDRNKSTVFFVDALGVEYLSYIQEKCKEQGLRCHIHICHGELPSITSMNKEFVHDDTKCVKELDELKHHNQSYDYEKQKLPIHLVVELQVIAHLLRDIKDKLLTKEIKEAVVVSDHGATRLAVLAEEENGASFVEGENKGQHGGRCCLVSEDPHLPYAAYENGYAILANYSRFKGSRKADVEVHGGATLEEVLIPLIRISLQPEDMSVSFLHDVVTFKITESPELKVVTNFVMEKPRLVVNGKVYEGILDVHKQSAKFVLVGMKRSRKYTADIYDGEECLKEQVPFELKRSVAKDRFNNLDI